MTPLAWIFHVFSVLLLASTRSSKSERRTEARRELAETTLSRPHPERILTLSSLKSRVSNSSLPPVDSATFKALLLNVLVI